MAKTISKHSHVVTANAAGFTGELTKMQKSLGLIRDENGLLTNSQGNLVETLSTTKIKLGQWIDENGLLRNSQGQIIKGINAARLAIGFYKDEMGNLFNKQGNVIQQSPALIAAQREMVTVQKEANEKLRTGAAATMQLTGLLIGLGGEGSKATRTMFVLSSGMMAFQSVSGALPAIVRGVSAINTTLTTTASLTALIKGLSGDVIGLLAGGAAAVGVMAWASQMEKGVDSVNSKVNTLKETFSGVKDVLSASDWNSIFNKYSSFQIENFGYSQEEQKTIIADIEKTVDNIVKEENNRNRSELQGILDRIKLIEDDTKSNNYSNSRIESAMTSLRQRAYELSDEYQAQKQAAEDQRNEQEQLTGTLKKYASEQEQLAGQYSFLSKITDEKVQQSEAFIKAEKEYAEKLHALTPEGKVEAKEKNLKEEIEKKYVSAVDAYTRRMGELTSIKDAEFVQSAAYQQAMEENRQGLLQGAGIAKYFEKIETAAEEFERVAGEIKSKGLLAGKSEDDINAAQERAQKEILKEDPKDKEKEKGSDATAAATRGSLEAYKITMNAQDKTTVAVKEMKRETVRELNLLNRAMNQILANNAITTDIPSTP